MPGEVKHWVSSNCVQVYFYKGFTPGCAALVRDVNCGACRADLKSAYNTLRRDFEERQRTRHKLEALEKNQLIMLSEIFGTRRRLAAKKRYELGG